MRREAGDREVLGPDHAVGDERRRRGPGFERDELRRRRAHRRRRPRARVAVDEQRDPVGEELAAHVRGEDAVQVVDRFGLAQLGRGLERVEPGIREDADPANLLDRRAVDLLDLAHHELEATVVGHDHCELVDRDPFTPFHDVDADDVGADRTDSGRDEAQRTGSVGEPDPHQDVDSRSWRCRSPW